MNNWSNEFPEATEVLPGLLYVNENGRKFDVCAVEFINGQWYAIYFQCGQYRFGWIAASDGCFLTLILGDSAKSYNEWLKFMEGEY